MEKFMITELLICVFLVKEYIKVLVGNKQLLTVSLIFFLYRLGFYIHSSYMNFFFNYYFNPLEIISKILLVNAQAYSMLLKR